MVIPQVGQAYLHTSPHVPKICLVSHVISVEGNTVHFRYWLSNGGWGRDQFGECTSPLWEEATPITQEQKSCMIALWCPRWKDQ